MNLAHDQGERPDDHLHDAEVVQNGKQRGHENDRRQDLKREDHAEGGVLPPQLAKDETGSREGETQDAGDHLAQPAKEALPDGDP
jgi:hypothetical protein